MQPKIKLVRMAALAVATCLSLPVAAASDCNQSLTPLSQVQGVSDRSPLQGERLWVTGLVSAVYQEPNSLKGFFLIAAEADQDNDPRTSEGLFVYSQQPVSVGESVVVSGQVTEFYGLTELTHVNQVIVCSRHNTLPKPTPISSLPYSVGWQESVESMPVVTPPMWVSGNGSLARYGELHVASDNVFEQAVQGAAPKQPVSHWVIDDAAPGNQALWSSYVDADNVRLGTSIQPFTAIASFGFGQYRLLPQTPIDARAHRPDHTMAPAFNPDANTRIAQLNVRNLFNGDGQGGGFPTSRGAKTVAEYRHQLAKLALTVHTFDADFVALTEIENDGYGSHSAISDLLSAVNRLGANDDPFAFAAGASEDSGSDQITQGLLYKTRAWQVKQVAFLPLTSPGVSARPSLMGVFINQRTGSHLQIAVVHYKSRRAGCAEDPKAEPAAGYCDQRRMAISRNLIKALDNTDDFDPDMRVIAGDFNAYYGEPALRLLTDAGWQESRALLNRLHEYTYVYRNKPGALDHFFVRSNRTNLPDMQQVDWHINAAESDIIVGEELQRGLVSVYRSSDHDPSILDLNWR